MNLLEVISEQEWNKKEEWGKMSETNKQSGWKKCYQSGAKNLKQIIMGVVLFDSWEQVAMS